MFIFDKRILYLAFVIDQVGQRPDRDKISVIIEMQRPKNVNQIKSFPAIISQNSISVQVIS